jgi:protein SERAC1
VRTAIPPDMATAIRSTIYRVIGLPIDKAENEIQSALTETIHNLLTEDEKKQAKLEITCIPSCDGSQTSSALVEFKGANPEFLSQLAQNPLGDWQVEMGDEDINFDRHFFGFTQLYPTAPGQPVSAEYGPSISRSDPDANLYL